MIGRTNSGSGGAGGTLTVTAPAGVYVILSEDGSTPKTYKIANSDGIAIFKGLKSGVWYVGIYDGEKLASKPVTITTDYSVLMSFNAIPEFTYTGDFEIVNDADESITTSQDNWKIRFLTSGVLTFTALNGAEGGIDVFLVGAGGGSAATQTYGGSGGGYTKTAKAITVEVGVKYPITVGAGVKGGNGGNTTAFSVTANGGEGATSSTGANGGSGGGAGWSGSETGSAGASNGGSASNGSFYNGGTGQGTTTREFAASSGTLYSGGGGGASSGSTTVLKGGNGGGGDTNKNGTANTGGGGGAPRNGSATTGGSGIVIIRNKR